MVQESSLPDDEFGDLLGAVVQLWFLGNKPKDESFFSRTVGEVLQAGPVTDTTCLEVEFQS